MLMSAVIEGCQHGFLCLTFAVCQLYFRNVSRKGLNESSIAFIVSDELYTRCVSQ